jgi:hypothetical protein
MRSMTLHDAIMIDKKNILEQHKKGLTPQQVRDAEHVRTKNRTEATLTKPDLRYCHYKSKKYREAWYQDILDSQLSLVRFIIREWGFVPNGPDPWGTDNRTDQELHEEIWSHANRYLQNLSWLGYNSPHDFDKESIDTIVANVFDVDAKKVCQVLGIKMPVK